MKPVTWAKVVYLGAGTVAVMGLIGAYGDLVGWFLGQ